MIDKQVQHLFRAIKKNDLNKIDDILSSGGDVYVKNGKKDHAFFNAVGYGDIDCIKLFIKYGADIHKISDGGMSVISRAIQSNNPQCIQFLLDQGVKVDGQQGTLALISVILTPANFDPAINSKMLTTLLKAGANPNVPNVAGDSIYANYSTLGWAALRNHGYAIKPLIDYGADINYQNDSGETPLMLAINNKYTDIISTLLSYDPDVDTLKNKENRTAVDLVKLANNNAITNLLASYLEKKSLNALIHPENNDSNSFFI